MGEVDLVVPVPKGTRARDLIIVIAKKKLSVGIKGRDKILDGELCQEIKLEDSTWTVGGCFCGGQLRYFLTDIIQRTRRPFTFTSRS